MRRHVALALDDSSAFRKYCACGVLGRRMSKSLRVEALTHRHFTAGVRHSSPAKCPHTSRVPPRLECTIQARPSIHTRAASLHRWSWSIQAAAKWLHTCRVPPRVECTAQARPSIHIRAHHSMVEFVHSSPGQVSTHVASLDRWNSSIQARAKCLHTCRAPEFAIGARAKYPHTCRVPRPVEFVHSSPGQVSTHVPRPSTGEVHCSSTPSIHTRAHYSRHSMVEFVD
jgi:hypothetical protein